MGQPINRMTPKWYLNGSSDETLQVIFELIHKRYTDADIAEHFNTPVSTIKGFMSKKEGVKEKVLEFRKLLDSDHPRAIGRCQKARWLINNSRSETAKYIKLRINNGMDRKDVARELCEMSGLRVTPAMVSTFVSSHMKQQQQKGPTIDHQTIIDNRIFSMCVIGSNPTALHRLGAA